jgi:phosphatidyl-myo-inositol dimannoside synthase
VSAQAAGATWVVVTPTFWPSVGGVESYLAELTNAIGSDRAVVIAPLTPSTGGGAVEAAPEARVVRIPRIRRVRFLLALWLTAVTARRDRVGFIAGMADEHGLAVLLVHLWSREPYVVIAYGQELLPTGFIRRVWRGAVLRRATHVVAISRYTAGLALVAGARGIPITLVAPPVRLVPDQGPVSEADLRCRHSLGARRVLLSVGRLEPRKGHAAVLRALAEVLRQHPDVVYVVVGDGPEASSLREQVGAAGLANHVVFTGFVSRDELDAWHRLASLFVLPSKSDEKDAEGFGIVYVEASSAATPVIGGRGGGTADAVRDGCTGLLVDPDDDVELLRAVLLVLGDRARARTMGEAGRRWAMGFTPDEFARSVRCVLTATAPVRP